MSAKEQKNTVLNILFVGVGSIGTRHLNNLHTTAQNMGICLYADALRYTKNSELPKELPDGTKKLLRTQYTQCQIDIMPVYDAVFITNPTNLHFEAMHSLRDKTKAWFIEKPIFDSTDYNINDCIHSWQKAYVAAPMRYCKTMLELKKILPNLSVYSARVLCSSYLPNWRKGVDYRTTYSAHKEMGGGVTIDLIHEWDYLHGLFGAPESLHNFKGTYSHLEINSDDISIYIAQYKNMLCEVHLDYFGRQYRRNIELFCKEGTVTADFGSGTLTLEDGTVIDCSEDVNERYLKEMHYFLNYVLHDSNNTHAKNESTNTPEHALEVLKLTLGEI